MAYYYLKTDRPIIFCANPRTASESTAKWFVEHGAIKEGNHHDPPTEEHLTEIREKMGREPLIVQTVRHHCDMLTSWWFFKKAQYEFEPNMEAFFNSIFAGNEPLIGCPRMYDKFETNFVMIHETLQYEFENLMLIAGAKEDDYTLPRTSSPRPPGRESQWHRALPWELHQKIQAIYANEMEELGYGAN